MASEGGFDIPFKEDLKCGMCTNMIKDARSVSCGHTFCLECLKRSASRSGRTAKNIKCSECGSWSNLPHGRAENLPRCFVINGFLDAIRETFGQGSSEPGNGGAVTIGPHGFQLEQIFSCGICLNLMTEPRYLPCGHSFCVRCLMGLHQTQNTPGIECSHCKVEHPLPPQGIRGLPVAYRIKSIAIQISANKSETSSQSSERNARRDGQSGPHHPPRRSSRSSSRIDDIDDEKRKAQAEYELLLRQMNGNTVTLGIDRQANINDLQKRVHERTGVDPAQFSLTCNGRNLCEGQRSLGYYNISNHSTVNMTPRMVGGGVYAIIFFLM